MQLLSFQNIKYNSNTYLIFDLSKKNAYLIDISEYVKSKQFITKNKLNVKFLFLTHSHYDHIFFIRELLIDFPECTIYAHKFSITSLLNSKLNLSFYHEKPISVKHHSLIEIEDGNKVSLDKNNIIIVFHTPGHNLGSLCFLFNLYLFTGDSFIPFYPVVTKLKYGNKLSSQESLKTIRNLITTKTLVAPGHGPICSAKKSLNYINQIIE